MLASKRAGALLAWQQLLRQGRSRIDDPSATVCDRTRHLFTSSKDIRRHTIRCSTRDLWRALDTWSGMDCSQLGNSLAREPAAIGALLSPESIRASVDSCCWNLFSGGDLPGWDIHDVDLRWNFGRRPAHQHHHDNSLVRIAWKTNRSRNKSDKRCNPHLKNRRSAGAKNFWRPCARAEDCMENGQLPQKLRKNSASGISARRFFAAISKDRRPVARSRTLGNDHRRLA